MFLLHYCSPAAQRSRLLPSAKSLSPTKVTQQSYQKVCFEHFGSGMECRPVRRDAIWTPDRPDSLTGLTVPDRPDSLTA